MLNRLEQKNQTWSPAVLFVSAEQRRVCYERNRHRVYAIAFWMTGNELVAETLMVETFRAAFAENKFPGTEEVDKTLLSQLKDSFDLPFFTLHCAPCTTVRNVRRNTLRVDLENAVIQLPPTEKLIFLLHDLEQYRHDRISRLLGITESESRLGLHQARLRVRELLPQ